MKQHFLQKAQTYNPKKHEISGRFVSEKLDGIRFFWDGGISNGIPVEQIPWSNIAKSNQVPLATGLWSGYGKVINAPKWWTDLLPNFLLDGELWTKRGEFQKISSVVRSTVNQKDWTRVKAMVFDTPSAREAFKDRKINETNFKKDIFDAEQWYATRSSYHLSSDVTFGGRLKYLQRNLVENEVVRLHTQKQLSFSTREAAKELEHFLEHVLEGGGEGLIIKAPNNLWQPERQWTMLKYKPYHDAEAEVIGYTWGRATDKGSKLLGKMGALICKINAGKFKLSGFTDEEREMQYVETGGSAAQLGRLYPGEIAGDIIHNSKFPRGSIITYKYRESTDDGLPKEARFWRNA